MPLIDKALLAKFDYIVCIDASEDCRLQFLEARGIDKDTAKKIMSFQPSNEEYKTNAKLVISNSADANALENNIEDFITNKIGRRI